MSTPSPRPTDAPVASCFNRKTFSRRVRQIVVGGAAAVALSSCLPVASPILPVARPAASAPTQATIWSGTDSQTTNSYWEPALRLPANSVSPVNYADGSAQIKIVIESKPSARPMKALVCFWRHGATKFQYETCRSAGVFTAKGTYRVALPAPTSWWKKGGTYDWTKQASVGRIMLVDPNTGKIFMNEKCGKACYSGGDLASHVPVRMTSQLIFVAKGATFKPPAGW